MPEVLFHINFINKRRHFTQPLKLNATFELSVKLNAAEEGKKDMKNKFLTEC